MNWDLSSYFPSFDGPEMRRFKQELKRDLDAVEQEAASLAPLGQDNNIGDWVAVFVRTEELLARLSHLGSYLGCLTAAEAANEAYKGEEAAFALIEARSEKLDVELKRGLAGAGEAEFSAFLEAPQLAGCAHHLIRVRELGRRTMAPGEERVASDLAVDGIHAWGRLYDTLSGKLEFDMTLPDGRSERLPMSQRRALTGATRTGRCGRLPSQEATAPGRKSRTWPRRPSTPSPGRASRSTAIAASTTSSTSPCFRRPPPARPSTRCSRRFSTPPSCRGASCG